MSKYDIGVFVVKIIFIGVGAGIVGFILSVILIDFAFGPRLSLLAQVCMQPLAGSFLLSLHLQFIYVNLLNCDIGQMPIKKLFGLGFLIVLITGFIIPQNFVNPVDKANNRSYNSKSFWYYPWGKSGTHKGVDIFAREGTSVYSSTGGLVLFKGEIERGGKVVLILGPKWRFHYYAHLREINTGFLSWTGSGERIGTVGTTGNANGKPPHLHYAIMTIIPYPWRIDGDKQGWKKMFYLNPITYLE
jgi:peptidoglycan LD-endopeptidase LytH